MTKMANLLQATVVANAGQVDGNNVAKDESMWYIAHPTEGNEAIRKAREAALKDEK